MAPYTTPAPDPHVYGTLANQAKQAYQNALARIGQQRGSLLRQFGYDADVDEFGNPTNMRISANNPHGRVQELFRGHAIDSESAADAQVSRGFAGGSGLTGRMLQRLRHAQQGETARMGEDLQQGVFGIADALRTASTENDTALGNATLDATRTALANQQFNPADTSGVQTPASGDSTAPPPSSSAPATSTAAGVVWGGRLFTNANALANWLGARGQSYAAWARNHPAAAAKLGHASGGNARAQ